MRNPTPAAYQDMKWREGWLVAGGLIAKSTAIIDWLDPEHLSLIRRLEPGLTDRSIPFTREGLDLVDGKLYLLPEDAPSRLFVFERDR